MATRQIAPSFQELTRNFPDDIYTLGENDHLTKLLKVLLLDPGVGQLRKIQTAARLAENLGGTEFSDLDYFYGTLLKFSRSSGEQYPYNPFVDQLTANQWGEVKSKDASYRERIRMFLQAIARGGTIEGMTMAAEAACGWPCEILEVWRYLDSAGLTSNPGRLTGSAATRGEFVVVPTHPISRSQARAVYLTVERLKPINTVVTVNMTGAVQTHTPIEVSHVASPSEYFTILKFVMAQSIVPPDPSVAKYAWTQEGVAVEAPTFAHMDTIGASFSLNESVASIESYEYDLMTGQYAVAGLPRTPTVQGYGPWREIDKADSPDNFPTGKFSGDPGHYDNKGRYVFSWASQSSYVTSLHKQVTAIGGQINDLEYRFPLTIENTYTPLNPVDALAPVNPQIQSTWFGG